MHFSALTQLVLAAAFFTTAYGHGYALPLPRPFERYRLTWCSAIIEATGNAGGSGTAIGIDESTPRTGTGRRPFQQDTTIFDGPTGCGRTLLGGQNNMETGTAAVAQKNGGLPQVTPGGILSMTLHQVNADGAGPYTCMIDQTGMFLPNSKLVSIVIDR